MSERHPVGAYGALIEPATLSIQRLLPGPIDRVWSYLTQSELRRQWLASGTMDLKAGSTFELVWRNDELTSPPGEKPADFGKEHRMQSRIVEVSPPHKLVFTWGTGAEVTFELEQKGGQVLLSVIHRRVTDRSVLLNVSAGWHAHLDILSARLGDTSPQPFWDAWSQLKKEYEQRLPA